MTEQRVIQCKRIFEDDIEVSVRWELNFNNGMKVVDISSLTALNICECQWVDSGKRYIEVSYIHRSGLELFALLDQEGNMIIKSLIEGACFISEEEMFIVLVSGYDVPYDLDNYFISDIDEFKWGVIDRFGKFVIPLHVDKVEYFDDEHIFVRKNNQVGEVVFDRRGKVIDK